MHSLYRCKCSIGYRPFGSRNIIAFPERQVSQVSVDLRWEANILTLNDQTMHKATQFANSLMGSTASVTLSDPYMTGASWAVLFDTAAAYTASDLAAANYIILPICKEGETPATAKCRPDTDLEVNENLEREDNIPRGALGSYAHLLIKFYYDVAGVRFGLDTYFRIQGFNIVHGKEYPEVQMRGVDPHTVAFNQSLHNIQMEENQTLEENLKRISKSFNHSVSFCTPPDVDYAQEYLMPVAFKEKMVTGEEVIKRYIRSVKGDYLKLPTKEFANKISVCTRANVNQGCSVFYLGKGLYEGYNITGGVERDVLSNNLQGEQLERALGFRYEDFTPGGKEYTLEDVFPQRRKAKLKDARRLPFPELFKESEKKYNQNQTSSGFIWKGSGPRVVNEEVRKTNLFGIGVNGDKALALLDGVVESVGQTTNSINIKTNYFMRICDSGKKCFSRPIYYEVHNLSSTSIKRSQRVDLNQEIGTATVEKKSFTRFYIPTVSGGLSITLDPNLVWNFAQPEEGLTDEERKKLNIGSAQVRRSASNYLPAPPPPVVPPAPKKSDKNWSAADNSPKAVRVLVMAGHADSVASGRNSQLNTDEAKYNLELVDWVRRNAARYGIQAYLEFYIPPSSNIPPPTPGNPSPNSQFSRTVQAVAQGKQVIEIHLDGPGGSSGVIPPNRTKGKKIWPLDDKLAAAYGAFPIGFRNNLGVPDRGGTILEVGRMDPQTVAIFKSGTPEKKEALYQQLMDPFMRAVSAEVQGSRQFATPAGSQPQSTSSNPICFRMGNSGNSTGPHLHAEWGDGFNGGNRRPITAEEVRKYVDVQGVTTSGWGPRWGKNHNGVDIANNIGTPICLKPGITVKEIDNSNCPNNGRNCGSGNYGNSVVINTPEGPMLLAHLSPDSDFSGAGRGVQTNNTGTDANPASKYGEGVQTAPSPVGVTVETEFNGIPRALRIVPGRTVLYFISDYDKWVEENRTDRSIDPGVWIPERFQKWFISEANYLWTQGNLRVKLRGVSDWGAQTARIQVPSWEDYRKTQGFTETKDYYGYIRSLGDLCWQQGDGKTSCEVRCSEAEEIRKFLQKGNDPASFPDTPELPSPTSVSSGFPTAKCKYNGTRFPKDRVQGIINAARQAGITSKAGFAGVVGNAIVESTSRLDPGISNFEGSGAFGIFQWLGSRRTNLQNFARQQGKSPSDFNLQMAFFVRELAPGNEYSDLAASSGMVNRLNSLTDPQQAAFVFGTEYERAVINGVPGTLQKDRERRLAASDIFSDLDCQ